MKRIFQIQFLFYLTKRMDYCDWNLVEDGWRKLYSSNLFLIFIIFPLSTSYPSFEFHICFTSSPFTETLLHISPILVMSHFSDESALLCTVSLFSHNYSFSFLLSTHWTYAHISINYSPRRIQSREVHVFRSSLLSSTVSWYSFSSLRFWLSLNFKFYPTTTNPPLLISSSECFCSILVHPFPF